MIPNHVFFCISCRPSMFASKACCLTSSWSLFQDAPAFNNLLKAASFGRHFLTETPGCPDRHREAIGTYWNHRRKTSITACITASHNLDLLMILQTPSGDPTLHFKIYSKPILVSFLEILHQPCGVCRSLRICRELRKAPIEIPITPAQLEKLGMAGGGILCHPVGCPSVGGFRLGLVKWWALGVGPWFTLP